MKKNNILNFNHKDMIKISGIRYDLNTFNLLIRLNENCNLDCKYCTMHSKNNKFVQPLENILLYIKETILLNEKRENINTIGYYFYGGEPTIYDYFLELIDSINNLHKSSRLNYLIEVQTNLTKPISFFKKINSNIKIKFIASYQNEAQNSVFGKNHLLKYKEVSKYLLEKGLLNGFDIMLEDIDSEYYSNEIGPNKEEIEEIYYYLKSIIKYLPKDHDKFGIQLNTINDLPVPKKYIDIFNDHKNITEKLNIELENNRVEIVAFNDILNDKIYNNFFGWKCDIFSRQVLLVFTKPEIKVLGCMSDMFSNKISFSKNIEEYKLLLEKYYFNNKKFRCLYKSCSCELFIPKTKGNK